MRKLNTIRIMAFSILLGTQVARAQNAAQNCEQAKDPKDVIAGCTDLISSGRGDSQLRAQILYLRGRAHARLKELDLALADYSQAVALDPDREDIYLDRGDLQFRLKTYPLAKQDYDHVINAAPEDLASALQKAGEADVADRAIGLFLAKGDAHFGLGFVARAQRDFDGANNEFNKAAKVYSDIIEKRSTNYEAYYQRARVNQLQYRYREANSDYDQAATLLEAKAATISDQDRVDAFKAVAKDWRKSAEYSKTMSELDKRFANYLEGIEKKNAYPNWSAPPWTTFHRTQLREGGSPAPSTSVVALKMPRTASPLPLLALSGVVLAALGILLRAFRLRPTR